MFFLCLTFDFSVQNEGDKECVRERQYLMCVCVREKERVWMMRKRQNQEMKEEGSEGGKEDPGNFHKRKCGQRRLKMKNENSSPSGGPQKTIQRHRGHFWGRLLKKSHYPSLRFKQIRRVMKTVYPLSSGKSRPAWQLFRTGTALLLT